MASALTTLKSAVVPVTVPKAAVVPDTPWNVPVVNAATEPLTTLMFAVVPVKVFVWIPRDTS